MSHQSTASCGSTSVLLIAFLPICLCILSTAILSFSLASTLHTLERPGFHDKLAIGRVEELVEKDVFNKGFWKKELGKKKKTKKPSTFWDEETEKHNELQNFLWDLSLDREIAAQLANRQLRFRHLRQCLRGQLRELSFELDTPDSDLSCELVMADVHLRIDDFIQDSFNFALAIDDPSFQLAMLDLEIAPFQLGLINFVIDNFQATIFLHLMLDSFDDCFDFMMRSFQSLPCFLLDSFCNGLLHERLSIDFVLSSFIPDLNLVDLIFKDFWEKELVKQLDMQKWLEKLAKYWEYTRNIFDLQLRASCKVRHQFSLENQNENENENHNENENENQNENESENQNENEKNFNITASSDLPQEAASMKQNGSFRRRGLHSIEDEIFHEKFVPLLLQWHFAKATSFQLYWHEAWKKYREISKKTVFEKWKDKALPHQLRREQLDCKALRSASFRALCPTSFEHNSFTESTFNEETFKETTFREETFKEETFPEESFKDSSLEEETFSESSFEESNLEERTFSENTFEESSLEEETFSENTFEKSSFDKSNFQKSKKRTALHRATSRRTILKRAAWKGAASTRTALTSTASQSAASTRAVSKRAASTQAASPSTLPTRAAWKRAACHRTASKTAALKTATLKKTAWTKRAFSEQLGHLSLHSFSGELPPLSLQPASNKAA